MEAIFWFYFSSAMFFCGFSLGALSDESNKKMATFASLMVGLLWPYFVVTRFFGGKK